ncbi:MAG: endonuclease domain-containing protein [Hyphomonadaceae bacterium]
MKSDYLTRSRARALRQDFTEAERILWSRLKAKQLGGWQFRAQHPVSPYILDFAVAKLKLAIELDGATHSTPDERKNDARRTVFLESKGWTVLRFWNDEVYRNLNGVIASIEARLPPKV